jgi:membrane associated rhomboid family serine protease
LGRAAGAERAAARTRNPGRLISPLFTHRGTACGSMGIYDRDYYQEDNRGWLEGGTRSMVVTLIIINIGVYLVQVVFQQTGITDFIKLPADTWKYPWYYWRLLSSGFAHAPDDVFHVLMNMYLFWLFGRDLEITLGRKEFLSFYLSAIVLSGLGWMASQNLIFNNPGASALGASGGVMAVAVLFALREPHRIFYFWFVPVPVWVLVGLIVLKDFVGFNQMRNGIAVDRIAYEAHLCGALAGFIYFKYQWSLANLVDPLMNLRFRGVFRRKPKLRVHREPTNTSPAPRDDLEGQVDRLLEKIQRHGEASLTASERSILEEASRRLRERKR